MEILSSTLTRKMKEHILIWQRNEITEYHVYMNLSRKIKNKINSEIIIEIANEELEHYKFWKNYSGKEVKPKKWKVLFYSLISRMLGITFGIRLMEKGEKKAMINYQEIIENIPRAKTIIDQEDEHEKKLITMIEQDSLNYIGSMVLGLNDALVELTGALAGLTFALQNTQLIALAGLITGIAASFSMAASEYLSNKSEGNGHTALKSATYTGVAYIITVFLLILPYFFINNYYICLIITLAIALVIIFLFNYYISVVKEFSFKKRFMEMSILSFSVALISFGMGFVIRKVFGLDI